MLNSEKSLFKWSQGGDQMNPDESKQAAKLCLSDYLTAKGINTSRNFSCLNPEHRDNNPSMSFDKKRNRCHCFSCGADYDIFDLVHFETGLSGKDLFDRVYAQCGIHVENNKTINQTQKAYTSGSEMGSVTGGQDTGPHGESIFSVEDFSDFFKACHKAVEKTDYWKLRGLSRETVDRYNLGFWEEKNRLVIPTGKSSYNARAINDVEKRFRYLKPKGIYQLFNLDAVILANEPVFVVEGEFDALSVIEAGGTAVALGSSGSMKFLEYLKINRPKFPLILALDNDDAGREGSRKLGIELDKLGIEYSEMIITGEYKDANEALVKDRESFSRTVQEAKDEVVQLVEQKKQKERDDYYASSAISGLTDFIGAIENRWNKDCITSGFSDVDALLDGGFYPGLYIMGAVSSLGKTTLALQIGDNAAKTGQDVLVFSLEMGKQELIAKSLSRLSYKRCKGWNTSLELATTTRNLLNGNALKTPEQAQFMNEALKDYASYAGRIFYHIGIGDIGVEEVKREIEKHIRITGKKPLVIIDYLQILAPYDLRATDKQNTDKAVVELKRASRDFDIPIFAISSFNRENYTAPVNIASFKESGAIEYTSDVLMALQFKGMDYQKKEDGKYEDEKSRAARIIALRNEQEKLAETLGKAQTLQLKVLKNRNGRKGSVDLDFVPMFNCFSEPEKITVQKQTEWVLKRG